MKSQTSKWFKMLITLRKNSVLFYLVCVIAVFFFGGIAHALFSDFFDACAVALKNTSHGYFLKIIDVLFVKAAKTDLTELMYMPAILIQLAFVVMPSLLLDAIRRSIRDMESVLKKSKDIDGQIDRIKNIEPEKQSADDKLEALAKENKEARAEAQDMLRFMRRTMRIGRYVAGISVALFLSDLTSNVVARSLFREYQWRVTTVRPHISDMEYHKLNRQWALMQGRSDYRKILRLLDEYAKRDGDRQARTK